MLPSNEWICYCCSNLDTDKTGFWCHALHCVDNRRECVDFEKEETVALLDNGDITSSNE